MNKIENNISFSLSRISTSQFAVIKESYKEGKDFDVVQMLNLGANKALNKVAVLFNIKFESDGAPFIILEITCEFSIESNSFKAMTDEETNKVHIPVGLARHLSVLTVGTARGVLHAKLESTEFKDFFLPTVNVNDLVKEEIVV
ncbi:MAG: hypothetical protein NVV82_22510 [Sporocytophaga sp.]|nr:hypothetical protein [Sporocytophaga sp.]